MFSEKFSSNSQEKEKKIMKNTAEFREALDKGNLSDAENFLNEVSSNPEGFPQYDDRWIDHRQRELFRSLNEKEDWQGAKRIVENTKDSRSKEGRIARLEELSGMSYDEI